jgi:hypothetical protein
MQNWKLVSFEPSRRLRFSVFVLPLLSALACEVRAEIDEREIRRAIERGRALRERSASPSQALQKHAWILKINDVRCGHASLNCEAVARESGAAYRISGESRIVSGGSDEETVVVQSFDFLLDTDLGLRSGNLVKSVERSAGGKRDAYVRAASVGVENDRLIWRHSERRHDAAIPASDVAKEFPLYGLRPIPEQALFLIALATGEWRTEHPLCIPTFTTGTELDRPDIQPAWLEFGDPVFGKPAAGHFNMILRYYFDGRISEDGWQVTDPEPVFAWPSEWILDDGATLVRPPRMMLLEHWQAVEPEKINTGDPLDSEKIKGAWSDLYSVLKKSEYESRERPEKLNELLSRLLED